MPEGSLTWSCPCGATNGVSRARCLACGEARGAASAPDPKPPEAPAIAAAASPAKPAAPTFEIMRSTGPGRRDEASIDGRRVAIILIFLALLVGLGVLARSRDAPRDEDGVRCSTCNGAGWIMLSTDTRRPCSNCRGRGTR